MKGLWHFELWHITKCNDYSKKKDNKLLENCTNRDKATCHLRVGLVCHMCW